MAAQRPAPFVGITRLGLTVAAAFGLGRVFGDGGWPLAVVGAAALPHAIVTYGDRRRWRAPLLLAVLAVAGLALTVYVVEPHTLRGVLPTGATVDAYTEHLGDAANELRTAVVPVSPTGSALLLALLSLFVAGAVAEWSARRLDVTLGAVGPSLVLFVALAALGEGAWAVVTAVYALAVAAYLLALHTTELLDRRSWFHASGRLHSRLLAGGSVAAVAIVFAAALVGPQLPGARSEAWLDYRSLGDGEGGGLLKVTTPIVQIQAKLLENPEEVVMIVSSDVETYHRAVGLDQYDGKLWTLNDRGDSATDIPPARERPESALVQLRYQLHSADPHWLPAAYRPQSISLRNAQVIRDSLTLYLNSDERLSNVDYTVTSRIATPTPEQFAAAEPVDPEDFARYLDLPSDFPERVVTEAEEVTADAEGPFEQALALRDYFAHNDNFTYDATVAQKQDIDSLEDFLFEGRRGYCEQFATAYGAMARAIGLPTRIAVGYTSGEPMGANRWRVRNKNAHAWPEVYLTGIGWFPFDPTPGFNEPRLDSSGGGPANPGGATTTTVSTDTTAAPGATAPTTPRQPLEEPQIELGGQGSTGDERSTAERIFANVVVVLVSLAVVAVVLVGVLFVAAWRRGWRRRHASDPRNRVLGAWAQALDYLTEAGVDPRPAATANEFALRYAPAHGAGDAGAALMRLARLQTVAMFAPTPPSDSDADEAWTHTDEIDRALWSKMSKLKRLRRRLDPRGRRPSDD